MEKVKIFVSRHCGGCQSLKELISQYGTEESIELIDIETEEGFNEARKLGLTHVPSVIKGDKMCKVDFSGGKVRFNCNKPLKPS